MNSRDTAPAKNTRPRLGLSQWIKGVSALLFVPYEVQNDHRNAHFPNVIPLVKYSEL